MRTLPVEELARQVAEQKRYKVAVIIPSGDRVHANFAMSLAMMTHLTRHSLVFVNPKGSNIPKQRNTGIAAARSVGCEWALMLDSDMSFPYDILNRLLAHGKEIIGASYARRVPPHNNLLIPLAPMALLVPPGAQPEWLPGLMEVCAIPTGALLIRLSVFEKFKPPYFRFTSIEEGETLGGIYKGPDIAGEDYGFCFKARELGFQVWCDIELSKEVIHWGEVGTVLHDPSNLQEPGQLVEIE